MKLPTSYPGMIGLFLATLIVGCDSNPSPTVVPEEPATSAAGVTVESDAVASRAVQMSRKASASVGDPAAQCSAGGAQACRTLCDAQAAVCNKDSSEYDKDDCKSASKDVPVCPSDPARMELGSLCRLPPTALSPTQGAVGMLAVTCKARDLEDKEEDAGWKLRRYLMARPVPVVVSPDLFGQNQARLYLTDHHHLATGLLISDVPDEDKQLYICPMSNRRSDESSTFWRYMENNNFTWLHNARGEDIPPNELPPSLETIADDPYRTLSRWVRDSCGYIKCGKECGGDGEDTSDLARCEACSTAPYFLEFRWADYMRGNSPTCEVPADVYSMSTTEQAAVLPAKLPCLMDAARGPEALVDGLPGWNDGLITPKQVQLDADGCEE